MSLDFSEIKMLCNSRSHEWRVYQELRKFGRFAMARRGHCRRRCPTHTAEWGARPVAAHECLKFTIFYRPRPQLRDMCMGRLHLSLIIRQALPLEKLRHACTPASAREKFSGSVRRIIGR